MNYKKSINTYSLLFKRDLDKTDEFFKTLYITPIHPDSLLASLLANSDPTNIPDNNVRVLESMFRQGIVILSDVTKGSIQHVIQNAENKSVSRREIDVVLKDQNQLRNPAGKLEYYFDSVGEDITSLSGKVHSLGSQSVASIFDEGDDITTLSRQAKNVDNIEIVKEKSSSYSKTSSVDFQSFDDRLRFELITNIFRVFQVWFKNIRKASSELHQKRNAFSDFTKSDLLSIIFNLPGTSGRLTDNCLIELLDLLKTFLNSSLLDIEVSDHAEFQSLEAIKEAINLIKEILRCICCSIGHVSKSSNEYVIVKSLLYTFYKVNFLPIFDKFFNITNDHYDDEAQEYVSSKIRSSPESLLIVYKIVGVLVNMPSTFLPENTNTDSSDITNLNNDSLNVYRSFMIHRSFDSKSYFREVASRILPFFAIDFNYYYNYRPDLLINQVSNSSFINWLTWNRFNDNLYLSYKTHEHITNLNENFKNLGLARTKEDLYLKDLHHIYADRLRNLTNDDKINSLETFDFLTLTLTLQSYSKSEDFMKILLDPAYGDIANEKEVRILDIWLCLLSYNFQYQYTSTYLVTVTRLSFLILTRFISDERVDSKPLIDYLANYQINEFKWKLCHQKLPVIPNGTTKDGFKSSLLYLLDVLQVFIRFNLTRKLDAKNYRLCLKIFYNIIEKISKSGGNLVGVGSYAWPELYRTILSLIVFIQKHDLLHSKYYSESNLVECLRSVVEESLSIISLLLDSKFAKILLDDTENPNKPRSIIYELVHSILLNFDDINQIIVSNVFENNPKLSNLYNCLKNCEDEFNLKNFNGEGMRDLDYESPIFIEMISKYADKLQNATSMFTEYQKSISEEKKHSSSKKLEPTVSDTDMMNIFNILFTIGSKRL